MDARVEGHRVALPDEPAGDLPLGQALGETAVDLVHLEPQPVPLEGAIEALAAGARLATKELFGAEAVA